MTKIYAEETARSSGSDGARCHAADAGNASEAARGHDEEAGEEEIEITPEMIEAGESVIYSKLGSGLPAFLSGADLAVMVYSAMVRVARNINT